jgi:acyl-CoA synthetase (NDP forming)
MATFSLLQANRRFGSVPGIRTVTSGRDAGRTLSLPLTKRDEARRREATIDAVRCIVRPRTVAVIAGGRDPQPMASRIVERLDFDGFAGGLYGVFNENVGRNIRNVTSIDELPWGIDLGIVFAPPDIVLSVVRDCARAGVRTVALMSPAIVEHGQVGRLVRRALQDLVYEYGIRVVGPNCLAVTNLDPTVRLHATWAPILPLPGRFSVASQHGTPGLALLDLAVERDLGVASSVDLGNRIDISSNDLLEYWEDDAATQGILLCVESLGNPWRFAAIARRISASKPIVAFKTSNMDRDLRIAGPHEGALAEDDGVVHEIFQQTGVIRADGLDEMVDIAIALDSQPLPRGRRVAIVSNGVDAGIRAADACASAGLAVAAVRSSNDRFDAVGGEEISGCRSSVEAVLRDPGVDSVIVVDLPNGGHGSTEMVTAIDSAAGAARAHGVTDKPVLASGLTGPHNAPVIAEQRPVVATYAFPVNAIRALSKITAYAAWRART